jgi:hypothetical protein
MIGSTSFLLSSPLIYKLSLNDDNNHMVILGDIELKRDVQKRLDEKYEVDDVMTDQYKFYDDIKDK